MTRIPAFVAPGMPQKIAGVPKILIGIAILDAADVAGYAGDRISIRRREISDDPGIDPRTEIRDMKRPRRSLAIERTQRGMKVSYGVAVKPL